MDRPGSGESCGKDKAWQAAGSEREREEMTPGLVVLGLGDVDGDGRRRWRCRREIVMVGVRHTGGVYGRWHAWHGRLREA